jgi:hypothetical protein
MSLKEHTRKEEMKRSDTDSKRQAKERGDDYKFLETEAKNKRRKHEE